MIKQKALKTLNYLLSFFPRRLPVGMTEFMRWSDRIIELSGKFADEESMRFVLASQVIHLGPQTSSKADQFFIRTMRKAAANQIASQAFQDIKNKQQKAMADAAAKQQAEGSEATSTSKVDIPRAVQ